MGDLPSRVAIDRENTFVAIELERSVDERNERFARVARRSDRSLVGRSGLRIGFGLASAVQGAHEDHRGEGQAMPMAMRITMPGNVGFLSRDQP
jgi:hypothetical protein